MTPHAADIYAGTFILTLALLACLPSALIHLLAWVERVQRRRELRNIHGPRHIHGVIEPAVIERKSA